MGPVDTGLSTGLRDVARPVSMAGERLLSVREPLGTLLPEPGLRRGAVVAVSGSTSLVLALVAEATTGGSWCAAAGLGSLGLVAAAELGVALERLVLVSSTDRALWPTVAATLLDAFDIVLARPPRHLRGAVLIVSGGEWPERADVRLTVTRNEWHGLGEGHGRLRGRRVEVVTGGRGAAARERLVALWLPAADGGISLADALADSVDEEPIGGVMAPPIALSTAG
ncbi:MAG: hypothetical protein E6G17_09950 [Actinobacteria bacterium]|nr:MAG: hypothetical protein E6G17_09950 [Actinomycetota bacterium]